MNRKIIVTRRPFWRHPFFPWGWYSLTSDDLMHLEQVKVDGYNKPGDGCERTYIFVANSKL